MATLTTLVNFNNRLSGISGVTIDNGDIFGTTYGESGGYGSGYGSVYELVNVGSNCYDLTTLVNFNITDGAYPYAGHLITDASGDLFGTTSEGGAYGDGTVFEVTKVGNGYASTPATLASFNGTDGN